MIPIPSRFFATPGRASSSVFGLNVFNQALVAAPLFLPSSESMVQEAE